MRQKVEKTKGLVLNLPFYIMVVFAFAHLSVYVQLDVGEKHMSLSLLNQLASMLYILAIYVWALLVNKKNFIKITAIIMGMLSVYCIVISLPDFGSSVNDALFTGTAVLSIFYVFENTEFLLRKVRVCDKCLTVIIWAFILFAAILFIFFPNYQTQWGEGTYFFGHRYASVCSLMIMVIGLKLLNRPAKSATYWILLFLCYYSCFWTGARVYMISNLGVIYAILFTFRKSNKDFIVKCIVVTLAVLFVFFTSSSSNKVENIVDGTNEKIEKQENAGIEVEYEFEWVNAISNGRLEIWDSSLASYQKLPIVNKLIGSGNKYIYDQNMATINMEIYAHTDFINILHFNGAVGLLIYLLVFIGYIGNYWKKHKLAIILLVGFWGVWLTLAILNGYANYTADMMSLPYICVMAVKEKEFSCCKEGCIQG